MCIYTLVCYVSFSSFFHRFPENRGHLYLIRDEYKAYAMVSLFFFFTLFTIAVKVAERFTTHTHTCTHTHAQAHTHRSVHTRVKTRKRVIERDSQISIYIYACVYIYRRMYIYIIYMYMNMYVRMCNDGGVSLVSRAAHHLFY